MNVVLVDQLAEADVLVTLKSYYRRRRRLINDAEQLRRPIYVLRANTITQMERFLVEAMDLEVVPTDPFEEALSETEKAIESVAAGTPKRGSETGQFGNSTLPAPDGAAGEPGFAQLWQRAAPPRTYLQYKTQSISGQRSDMSRRIAVR